MALHFFEIGLIDSEVRMEQGLSECISPLVMILRCCSLKSYLMPDSNRLE